MNTSYLVPAQRSFLKSHETPRREVWCFNAYIGLTFAMRSDSTAAESSQKSERFVKLKQNPHFADSVFKNSRCKGLLSYLSTSCRLVTEGLAAFFVSVSCEL